MRKEFVHFAGRDQSQPKRSYRPAQSFTCAGCGKAFNAAPSDRVHAKVYCSLSCAASAREKAKGRRSYSLPCEVCGNLVTRPGAKMLKNIFCCREHYFEWRHDSYLGGDKS